MKAQVCLNPYSNGLPSRGLSVPAAWSTAVLVLIPILMDYPLGAQRQYADRFASVVLIPILMDYPLGGTPYPPLTPQAPSLNPYSNGLPSRGTGRRTKKKRREVS